MNLPSGTLTTTRNAVPESRWQSVQWQMPTASGSISASKATPDHSRKRAYVHHLSHKRSQCGKDDARHGLGRRGRKSRTPNMLVDLDPGGSIMAWTGLRKAEAVNAAPRHAPMCCSAPHGQLRPVLEVARSPSVGARIAVIDTASGADPAALDAASRAAHLVLVPCRPADVTAIGPSIDLARQAGTPTFVVLNDVPIQHRAGFTTVPQARKALAALGIRLLAHRHVPPAQSCAGPDLRTDRPGMQSQATGSPGD